MRAEAWAWQGQAHGGCMHLVAACARLWRGHRHACSNMDIVGAGNGGCVQVASCRHAFVGCMQKTCSCIQRVRGCPGMRVRTHGSACMLGAGCHWQLA
eukprot:364228-Chlamydomonas_euryale.AAC.2